MLTRQQKRKLLVVVKFIVPVVVSFLLTTVGLTAYTIHFITHPTRTSRSATPNNYKILGIWIPYTEETWSLKGGGEANGWLLRASNGAPAVVLSHSYGQNMADLLSLGVALQRAGYHALLYDMRAHGESKIEASSLGEYEADDIISAIDYLKTVKDQEGNPVIDKDRIGLYGVSVGGYASIIAAAKDSSVKAIAIDAVYPDAHRYLQIKIKSLSGFDNGFVDYISELGMKMSFPGKYGTSSVAKSVKSFTEVKQLYILGKDAGDLLTATGNINNEAASFKETVEVPHSRINILYKNDQDVYDPVVVDFFRRPDVMPPIPVQNPPLNASK